jgi:hypothetical protein
MSEERKIKLFEIMDTFEVDMEEEHECEN